MQRSLCVLAGLLCLCVQAVAGTELILTDAGYQVMTISQDGATITAPVKVDAVRDYRTGAPVPPPGPTPTPNPPPGEVTRAMKIEALSELVNDPDGAMGWAAVARMMVNSIGSSSLPEANWKSITNVTLAGVSAEKKAAWATWLEGVNATSTGKYDKAFFQDVETGLVKAYNLPTFTIDAIVAAGQGEATAEEQAAIPETFAWIIQLITFILEMLKQFGILAQAAGAFFGGLV